MKSEKSSRTGGAYDLLVIGGGPAGSAAAWQAARGGLRVLLAEQARPGQDRVCGEFISSEAGPILQAMLAEAAPQVLPSAPRIEWLHLAPQCGAVRSVRLPRPALGISRLRLDAALWRAAEWAGAAVMAETRARSVRRDAAGYAVGLENSRQGNAFEVTTRALVLACGRWWRIAGLNGPAEDAGAGGRAWAGVKARFRPAAQPESAPAAVELYFFPGGYCGLAPVENGWVNACCLVRRELLRAPAVEDLHDFAGWLAAVARHPALAARLAGARQVTPTVATAPVALGAGTSRHNGIMLAGDAAGFLDPFTGDGIARALCGGARAGELLAEACHAQRAAAAPREWWPALAAGRYAREWRHSGLAAFRAAAGLRLLMALPAPLQNAAVYGLARPALARLCFTATRWRT